MTRKLMNTDYTSLIGVGIFIIFMVIVPINVNAARAGNGAVSNPSLVDILTAKGVLSQREAQQVKKAENVSHKKLRFGGRVFADYAFYADDPGLDLGDGAEVRKARLFARGMFGDWRFKGQYDFATNATRVKDAYIRYVGFAPVTFEVGNFKEPFSLEEMTSTKYTVFMERALSNALVPGRHIGAGLSAYGNFWTASIGAFSRQVGNTTTSDSNFDLTGRVTLVPVRKDGLIVHLGSDVSYRLPDSTRAVRFRERPESHVTNIRLVDTGAINNVNNFISYGLEGAAVYGPLSVQGEYVRTDVNFQNGLANAPIFNGFYVYASWFVTGESRPYRIRQGAFGRVRPNHNLGLDGWGALELAARFSQLDLEDTGLAGGKEQNVTVGANWYPHSHVRFMFNWVHISVDHSPLRVAHPLMALNNYSPDAFQMRAQLDF